jgi:hypothetical protein
VFAPISAIFALLVFASTLQNGIRLVEHPPEGDSVEVVVGYTSGGLTGFVATSAARELLFDAYAAGGRIAFINELNRSGLRITVPLWALPMLADHLPSLFTEIPQRPEGPARADLSDPSLGEFRAKVEEEIRGALLGAELPAFSYATEDAFVLVSATVPNSLREGLAAIPKRASATMGDGTVSRLPAERTLRFKSADLPDGAVIFASPISGVYYRQWYAMLLLDRLIRRAVPLRLATSLPLTVHPYYYRLELTVPSGQFPEPAEENLMQELQRLQFTRANQRDLLAARQDALAYLESKPVKEWFASYDLPARREEGMQWIEAMSTDDLRVTARDLLLMNRVIATWSPKPRQTSVSSEPLSTTVPLPSPSRTAQSAGDALREARAREGEALRKEGAQSEGRLTSFAPHTDVAISPAAPERLPSGVSLAAGTANAVFVSGGSLTRFDRDLTPDDLRPFQQYHADRILVLTPAASLDRARQLWSAFKGNASGQTGVPKGKISSGDLSAIFILKTILDLKLIQAGWWRDVAISIDANEGATLQIHSPDDKRAQILDWIKAIADTPLADAYFKWVREVAIHRFDGIRADLQALVWDRDRQGLIPGIETVSAGQIQDVARIYF